MDISSAPEGLQAQHALITKLEEAQFGWELMVGDAFVRGMRDIGYKSTAFALAELIDNSIQASASHIDIILGFDKGLKPTKLAVVDDGHGMEPKMVRASLIWGAGTRATNRDGFGKYGYGLPSASVSQCARVTVYSKINGGEWHRSYLDIDEIADGSWSKDNRIQMPAEVQEEPPAFVVNELKARGRWDGFGQGTIVVWDRLDRNRIDYKRREELRNDLIKNLGVIYRNFIVETPMTVDGEVVEPCDPLFLTEGFRYYDLDEDRAIELPSATVDVKDKKSGTVIGKIRVRFSRLPSTFFRKPELKRTNKPGRSGTNERLDIADANNGICFLRNGRQIDVIRPPRKFASFNATTDRYWGVEVDFDATLDDMFAITTSKQQVTPDERVWDMLRDKANLFTAIGEMRTAYGKEAKVVAVEAEQAKEKERKRASIEAIEEAGKFRTTAKPKDTEQRRREAKHNLNEEAKKRASKAGMKPEVVGRELEADREGVTHSVEIEDMPGAPFFRCVQEGGTRVLYLNAAHAFYAELYAGPQSNARLRAGLEVLLWCVGNAEIDSDPETDRRRFYERERASVWTPTLADALSVLKTISLVQGDENDDEDVDEAA